MPSYEENLNTLEWAIHLLDSRIPYDEETVFEAVRKADKAITDLRHQLKTSNGRKH